MRPQPEEVIERIRSSIAFLSASFLVFGTAFAQQSLSIATGGTSGVDYPTGGACAEIVNDDIDGYIAAADVTGAPSRPAKAPRTTGRPPPARVVP